MKKIAFIVHQYGDKIVGGAEGYTKTLAEYLSDKYDVTVFTTTSIDYNTWEPYYEEGTEIINGVSVQRYNVVHQRIMQDFVPLCNKLNAKIEQGKSTTIQEDIQWLESEGPFCPQLVKNIVSQKDDFDLIIVVTYIYYIAAMSIPKIKDKCLFISTAHDEPWINLSIYKDVFNAPAYFGFLTEAERDLVQSKFNNAYIPYEILGSGISVPEKPRDKRFRDKFGIQGDYLVYVGRIDESKGCKELCDYFLEYKRNNKNDLKLVLVGKGTMEIPSDSDIIATGFVAEEEKYDAISGAFAMVTPSKYESLCIALLEGMALKIPIIANAKCAVLKQHCIKSNAGLYYENVNEFCRIIDYFYKNKNIYTAMGDNGKRYVDCNYTWNIVEAKIDKILKHVAEKLEPSFAQNVDKYKIHLTELEDQVRPISEDAICVVTAADNNYGTYAGITINSIIKNATQGDKYDILVFTNDMSDEKIQQILLLRNSDVSIRFVYVDDIMKSLDINISNNYKIVTYYRLLLQRIMRQYNKVIYMDSDIIVNHDLHEAWNIDISDFLVAGTYDSLIAAWQSYDSGMQAYFETLNVNQPGQYLQAGFIILNIKELNDLFASDYLLNKACQEHFIFADQDLLNIACKGKIKYIDQAWDVLNLSDEGRKLCYEFLEKKFVAQLEKAEETPKAIHYVEQSFPILGNGRKFGNIYWKYVYDTVFYSELLEKKRTYLEQQSHVIQGKNNNHLREKMNHKLRKIESNLYINNEKHDGGNMVLHPGDVLSGPRVFLSKGSYIIKWKIRIRESQTLRMLLKAGARRISLEDFNLSPKTGSHIVSVGRNYSDCEMIIENTTIQDIRIDVLKIDRVSEEAI